jgi:hypothetical protein
LFDVEGTAGRVKLELNGNDGKTYSYETPANDARNLYVRFADFRAEIGGVPSGAAFARETGASVVQLIAIGETADGPVDFTLRSAFLLIVPQSQAEYSAVIPGAEINSRADLRYYLTAVDAYANQSFAPGASAYYTVTVIDNIPPGVPANLQVTGSGDGWAELEWQSPGDADLAGYEVRYRFIDEDKYGPWQSVSVTDPEATVTVLINGLSYEFQVRAYDDAPAPNYSDWSDTALAYPVEPDAGVPDSGPADAEVDAGEEAGSDAGYDAGHDAGHDAGFDAGYDAGRDAGRDAAVPADGGAVDAMIEDAAVPSKIEYRGGCGCSMIGY